MRRGQAALEFLMTYGWALLMLLVIIAALTYFGVLRPKDLLPDRCLFGPEIECLAESFSSAGGIYTLKLRNNVGEVITVTNWNLEYNGPIPLSCAPITPLPTNWVHRETKLITTTCDFSGAGLSQGKTAKFSIDFSFYPVKVGSAFSRTAKGEIITKIQ